MVLVRGLQCLPRVFGCFVRTCTDWHIHSRAAQGLKEGDSDAVYPRNGMSVVGGIGGMESTMDGGCDRTVTTSNVTGL